MELLQKAEQYQKSINMAMVEYEKAKESFEATNNMAWNVTITEGDGEADINPYKERIDGLMQEIVSDIVSARENTLNSAEMRLAVLINDKETFSDDKYTKRVELPFQMEGEKKNEENPWIEMEEEKKQEYKSWLDVELLRKELEGENAITITQFAKKYNCNKKDVRNAVERKHIQYSPGKTRNVSHEELLEEAKKILWGEVE